jgi:hypothetical protein
VKHAPSVPCSIGNSKLSRLTTRFYCWNAFVSSTCHNWSLGTHTQYQGKLRILRDFESCFGVRVLQATVLDRPPSPPAISIMWAQQRYSLRQGKLRGTELTPASITFAAVRGLRNAANQFFAWDLQVAYPDTAMKDASSRAVVTPGCLPAVSLVYAYMTSGMTRRLGDESKPSMAILQRHVRWINKFVSDAYLTSPDPEHRAGLPGLLLPTSHRGSVGCVLRKCFLFVGPTLLLPNLATAPCWTSPLPRVPSPFGCCHRRNQTSPGRLMSSLRTPQRLVFPWAAGSTGSANLSVPSRFHPTSP